MRVCRVVWRPELSVMAGEPADGSRKWASSCSLPLQLADGSLLWVQRGWQPRSQAGYAMPALASHRER